MQKTAKLYQKFEIVLSTKVTLSKRLWCIYALFTAGIGKIKGKSDRNETSVAIFAINISSRTVSEKLRVPEQNKVSPYHCGVGASYWSFLFHA